MKKIKDLIILPPDGSPAKYATGDPEELPADHIGIDLDLADLIRSVTTVPIDTSNPEVLARQADFLRRHGFNLGPVENVPTSDIGREYLDKFRKEPLEKKEVQREINETELKRLIVQECEEKAARENREFVWDNATAWMVRNMMYYFGNHPDCEWPYGKGLLLSGNVGVGKTWMFEIFQQVAFKYLRAGGKRFKMTTCRNLYDEYTEGKGNARKKYLSGNWCFDDLGNEPVEHKDYGNSTMPVEEILILRYGCFQTSYQFTHISTNLSLDEIRDRYGLRMFDRLMQMMHPVEWTGESKRK